MNILEQEIYQFIFGFVDQYSPDLKLKIVTEIIETILFFLINLTHIDAIKSYDNNLYYIKPDNSLLKLCIFDKIIPDLLSKYSSKVLSSNFLLV